ncbi:LOW QUALITY PROTEIN: hypothetical protein QTO34_000996 [Cnephaeus nilssonii]|uniref:T-cell activation Rho GTPase-activating protein n=1 Tax=Cnephaeus nilssonii TaxID=3371016 RepID=A0AA40HVW9_CNENI|nr:LOW QUALITY PROTEIN: hypothetical protein QTO34_000996 [Eptesicus nilssonii]
MTPDAEQSEAAREATSSGQSAKLLMKLTSSCNASKTLNVNNMETLIECQSEGDIKQHPLLASCESEDSICQLIEIKKRKKVLSWPFPMRRLSPPSDFSGASEPELKASLFDQPLSIICGDDDTLPRPIQDILTILCLKGPSTEGIFRKAANEKARKELKEELNSGVMVDLKSLPVHLLAVVFKDFLRSIPRKLLSCDLFEDWMGALERQNEEDRIEALKQVAEKLPRPNLLLLKHLLSVLYLVSKNAEVSKMDASNLAICVGPNMLTRENDQILSLEAQKDLNNQVKTLVEFLIDNCLEIFGENIPVHSSSISDDSLEHTDGSDSNDPDGDCGSALGSPARLPPGPWDTAARVEPVASTAETLPRRPRQEALGAQRVALTGAPGGRQANPKLTRSEDAPAARPASGSGSEEAEDPFPEEVFPAVEGGSQRPQDLWGQSSTQGAVSPQGRAPTACSSGSLDASSDSSPPASPASPRRNFFSRHQSFTKTDKSKPSREIKKHSMSFSFASHKRTLPKPPSLSVRAKGLARDPGRKDFRRESQLAGRIVQENFSGLQPKILCPVGEDVFRLVDRTRPGSPPSYEEAVRGQAPALAARGSQTVGSLRARMLSLDSGLAPRLPVHHGGDSGNTCSQEPLDGHRLSPRTASWSQSRTGCASVETVGQVAVMGRPELHRLRAVSESTQRSPWDCLAGRCSQPAFEAEQLLYAKESYI